MKTSPGLRCEEGIPYEKLEPGDLWTSLPAQDVLRNWTMGSVVSLSLRSHGAPKLFAPETVTRVILFHVEAPS